MSDKSKSNSGVQARGDQPRGIAASKALPEEQLDRPELERWTTDELRQHAQGLGVDSYDELNRDQLLDAIDHSQVGSKRHPTDYR